MTTVASLNVEMQAMKLEVAQLKGDVVALTARLAAVEGRAPQPQADVAQCDSGRTRDQQGTQAISTTRSRTRSEEGETRGDQQEELRGETISGSTNPSDEAPGDAEVVEGIL